MVQSASITRLHDRLTTAWHDSSAPATSEPDAFLALVAQQHRENFDLWHEEDKARDPDATDSVITHVKHAIDKLNQRRNDLVESMDEWLLENLPTPNPAAPLNSETPGLIIDRLSILSLRIYHTHIEAHRDTASEAHRLHNARRLAVLDQQRNDLAGCLDALLAEVISGRRRFKLYRQMKMYNDPNLNPAAYSRTSKLAGS